MKQRSQSGFTLVELMVATTIFLGLSIVVFSTLTSSEGQKRATTSVDDVTQEGAYAMYQLGTWIRSAGSGFAQNYLQAYGCRIGVSKSGTALLPRATAWPAPFASIGMTLYLAPVVVYKGASQTGSDVIAVMAGTAGYEQTNQQLISLPTSTAFSPSQTNSIKKDDLILFTDVASASMADCVIEQVTSSYSGAANVQLSGSTYYSTGISGGKQLSGYSVDGYYTDIGTIGASGTNPPLMQLIGVGTTNSATSGLNYSLFSYDVLQSAGQTAASPIVDGVIAMRVLYGIDSDGDGDIDAWQDPGTSPYDSVSLLANTPAAAARLRAIKAIRIGLILRSNIAEKSAITTATIGPQLFVGLKDASNNSLTWTLPNTATAPAPAFINTYRYRTLESTIPIRNNYLN